MSYLDKYPHCIGCPVYQYCGTMISSIRLCNSYNDNCTDALIGEAEAEIEDYDAYTDIFEDVLEDNYGF